MYLNDRTFWRNVPAAVWSYKLGGYQVLKKWLSYRERNILDRPLKPEEVQHFTDTARRIARIVTLSQRCRLVMRKRARPMAATLGHSGVDYEYERAGTASVFLFSEPLKCWRRFDGAAGGEYFISGTKAILGDEDDRLKADIMACRTTAVGNCTPTESNTITERQRANLRVSERANRILKYIDTTADTVGFEMYYRFGEV